MEKDKQNNIKKPVPNKEQPVANRKQTDGIKKRPEEIKKRPDKVEPSKSDSRLYKSLSALKGISGDNKKKLLNEIFIIADNLINYQIAAGDLDSSKKFKLAVAIVTKKLIEAAIEIRDKFKQFDGK